MTVKAEGVKALRYSFITKGGGTKMNWTAFDGYKRGFVVGHIGMPAIMVNHSKYRHVGHTYILRGYAKKMERIRVAT